MRKLPVWFLADVLDTKGLNFAWSLAGLAERVDREGAGPGSLTEDGLHYSVVTGEVIEAEAPELFALLTVAVPALCSAACGEPLWISAHLDSAVNVNVVSGQGGRYEPHTDSCPYTCLIFVTGEHAGGQLALDLDGMTTLVSPRSGSAVLFAGDAIPHWVCPLERDEERITLPVAMYPFGEFPERDPELDSHLYR